MINIAILILVLGYLLRAWYVSTEGMGTKSNPVFNLRAEDFNSFSLAKSALVSPVPKGCYKKASKEAAC